LAKTELDFNKTVQNFKQDGFEFETLRPLIDRHQFVFFNKKTSEYLVYDVRILKADPYQLPIQQISNS